MSDGAEFLKKAHHFIDLTDGRNCSVIDIARDQNQLDILRLHGVDEPATKKSARIA